MNEQSTTSAACDLISLSVAQASQLIRDRALSPVELVEAFLKQIARVDEKIKSYILVDEEGALIKAERAEAEVLKGNWRGPLHGIPYGAKDNYFTKGLRTCANSRLLLDHVPAEDAAAIEQLTAAGAILLGKLNTWEYGFGTGLVYHDAPFPHARNPWNENHFTGGSSTGAGASVAAGTAMFSLGADTGGSIRVPAAACGIQGLKPTSGRVSRFGILPNSWSLDVAGVLCWTVEDCALIMQVISGYDPRDPGSAEVEVPDYLAQLKKGVHGLRIGVVRDLFDDETDSAVLAGFHDVITVLKAAGATLVNLALPHSLSVYNQTSPLITGTERATAHEHDFVNNADLMGRELRESIMAGFAARAVDYVSAQRRRRELALEVDAVIRSYDAILLPCSKRTAPPLGDFKEVQEFQSKSVMSVFNLSGHPAIAVRTGHDANGLPTGVQIAGRYFDEGMVLRVAHAYESARDWHTLRPAL